MFIEHQREPGTQLTPHVIELRVWRDGFGAALPWEIVKSTAEPGTAAPQDSELALDTASGREKGLWAEFLRT